MGVLFFGNHLFPFCRRRAPPSPEHVIDPTSVSPVFEFHLKSSTGHNGKLGVFTTSRGAVQGVFRYGLEACSPSRTILGNLMR